MSWTVLGPGNCSRKQRPDILLQLSGCAHTWCRPSDPLRQKCDSSANSTLFKSSIFHVTRFRAKYNLPTRWWHHNEGLVIILLQDNPAARNLLLELIYSNKTAKPILFCNFVDTRKRSSLWMVTFSFQFWSGFLCHSFCNEGFTGTMIC